MQSFRLIPLFAFLFAGNCPFAQAGEKQSKPEIPALPRQVAKLESIVPNGWRILAQASGDLNRDDLPDSVVIVEHATDSANHSASPRLLIVLVADGSALKVSAVSYQTVRPRLSGGIWGDPFEELKIERGTFVVSHYAGSRDRWGYKHRYRWQDGGWFLIGRTTINHDTLSPEHHEKDENLITGRVIEKDVDAEGNKSETDKKIAPVALIPLGAGKWQEDGYFELP